MAEKENSLEKGEYVIGIAIILAALLVSATVWIAGSNLEKAIGNIKIAAPSGTGTGTQQPTQPANNTQPSPPTQPAAPKALSLDYSTAYFEGPANADLVMVEYSDFQCPYCGAVAPTISQVQAAYPNMKLVFRHFPLSFHPYAEKAAEAAECAGAQGQANFWKMHDAMFADQNKLAVSDLKAYAANFSLNTTAFNSCLDNGDMASKIAAEEAEGQSVGIGGTPGFMVYSKTKSGAALEAKLQPIVTTLQGYGVDAAIVKVNGQGEGIVFAGALPYANFQQILDAFN
ncbi:Thioredoxin [uncultured archaeon]|nr:Thioredoxin [uncultured archaeon]